jgi:hypothetical protein
MSTIPESVLKNVLLDGNRNQILRIRLVTALENFHRRTTSLYWLLQSLRATVLGGSVMMPALLFTVASQIEVEKREPVFWVCFSLSVTVGISTAILEGFSIGRQYHECLATSERLHLEFWAFVSLSGKYSKYKTHNEAWKYFFKLFEKTKTKHVEATLMPSNSGVFTSNKSNAIHIFQATNDLNKRDAASLEIIESSSDRSRVDSLDSPV